MTELTKAQVIEPMESELRTGFKMTELGPLPEEWLVSDLGALCEKPQYGLTATAQHAAVGPRFLRITDIQDGRVNWGAVPYCKCDEIQRHRYALKSNDIVVARIGATTGKAFIVRDAEDCVFASYLIRLRAGDSLSPDFLWLFTQSRIYWSQIDAAKGGRLKKGVNIPILKGLQIPTPPLAEQFKIAAVLNRVRRAIETTEHVIAATRELKRSLMRHLFTYGPVPVDRADQIETEETRCGVQPAAWKVGVIRDLCDVRTSSVSFSKLASLAKESGGLTIHGLKVSDMNLPGNEVRIRNSAFSVQFDGEMLEKVKTVPPGSIVFPKRGAAIRTNKKRLTTQHSILDPNLIAVIPIHVDGTYLFRWFETFDISTVHDVGTLPQLNKKDIEPLAFPLPSENQQRAIVSAIGSVDYKLETEQRQGLALEFLFKTLLQKLMTGEIRVTDSELEEAM